MIEDKITNLMRALKDGPAETVEKAMTAEAVWPGAEFPTAEAKTAAGTEAASNAEIFSESNDVGLSIKIQVTTFAGYSHYDKNRKNIFFNPRHSIIRRAYAYE
jgi:deferrochelatase/peroxidase EfeB